MSGAVLLTAAEVADRCRVETSTLRTWRWRGVGPRSTRRGGRVVYRLDDVVAWETVQDAAARGGVS